MISLVRIAKKGTIGETYKTINKLLKDEKFDQEDFIQYNPGFNAFEKKVQAIYIDTFKIKEGVVNCLLSNDPQVVRRILKCNWFFEEALTPKEYKENIFPKVSFSTRCRIINQLSRHIKSENQAKELFQYFTTEYGSKYAEMILPRCSSKFISNYINDSKPDFNYHNSETVLINICKRFPDIIIPFLQRGLCSDLRGSLHRCQKLVKYLAKNHPAAFLPIFERYQGEMVDFYFGKRSSKSLRFELLEIIARYPSLAITGKIDIVALFKYINFDGQINFIKALVKAHGLANSFDVKYWGFATPQIISLLKVKPATVRVKLLETAFVELFNQDLLDHPEVWSLQFLEMLPKTYRGNFYRVLQERCMEREVSRALLEQCTDLERDAQHTFLYLATFGRSFGILCTLMQHMTTSVRREILLREMIRNTIIDRDPSALATVLNYISWRHRNEEPGMIQRLLFNYLLMEVPVNMMTEKIWSTLEDMAGTLMLRMKNKPLYQVVLEGYIAYSFKENLNVERLVKTLIKTNFLTVDATILISDIRKPYSRNLIICYYEEIFSDDEDYVGAKDNLCTSLLMTVNNYNTITKRNRIKIEEELPLLVEYIDGIMKSTEWREKRLLTSGIIHNAYLKEKYADSLLDISMTPSTLYYLMKHHPKHVKKDLDKIIDYILQLDDNEEYKRFFTSRCQIDFLGWLPIFQRRLREIFKAPHSHLMKINALKFYSHVSSVQNFKKFIPEYIPNEESSVKLKNDDKTLDFQEIQILVPQLIKNMKPDAKNWKLILHYLNKNHLKWVLPSLLSFACNSSIDAVTYFLQNHLNSKSVAVKKSILRCILNLSSSNKNLEICKMVWKDDDHPSVRECIFKFLWKRLKYDPRDQVFSLIRMCFKESNETIIRGKVKMDSIPLKYLAEYTMLLWQFAENCESKCFTMMCKKEILNRFSKRNINLLPPDFCQHILKAYVFLPDCDLNVDHFLHAYIMYHPQEMDEKTNFFMELLKERRNNYGPVRDFVNLLQDIPHKNPESSFILFEALLNKWQEIYGCHKMFNEYLLISYVNAYGTAYDYSSPEYEDFFEELGRGLRKVIDSIPAHHNFAGIISDTLRRFLTFYDLGDNIATVIDYMMGNEFDVTVGSIAIDLLPQDACDNFNIRHLAPDSHYSPDTEREKKLIRILRKLIYKNDNSLRILLNIRVNNKLD